MLISIWVRSGPLSPLAFVPSFKDFPLKPLLPFALTRRSALLSLGGMATLGLGGCLHKTAQNPNGEGSVNDEGSLAWAVAGSWRSKQDKARDPFRHPIETLSFFEIRPNDVVIDMWPGGGYTTEILSPFLSKAKGQYIAALFETDPGAVSAPEAMNKAFKAHFDSRPETYGKLKYTEFGPRSLPLAESNSIDKIFFFLRIQDWMSAGIAEKAFADSFQALKPGGILGIEQHRADIGNVQDPAATSGYVQEPFVKQLAAEAGFQFVETSEINANPKDSKDYPFGVWTLPPQRLTAPRGQAPNPEFDGTLYESIGESDRMTLKFKKPS